MWFETIKLIKNTLLSISAIVSETVADIAISAKMFGNLECSEAFSLALDFTKYSIRETILGVIGCGKLIPVKTQRHVYDLVYYDGAVKYRVRFRRNRGPFNLESAELFSGIDVTEQVLEAVGPGHNFHGIPTTPLLLGFDSPLKITYISGDQRLFQLNDIIEF